MYGNYDELQENRRSYKGFSIIRTDPYGLWVINDKDGKSVDSLGDSYTMPSMATKAIDVFVNRPPESPKKSTKGK